MLPASRDKKILPVRGNFLEVFAYSAAHIAEIENDFLFIAQARARLGSVHPRSTKLGREAGGFFQNRIDLSL